MPKLSVDAVIDQLAPWDLRLTIDGQEFQTKPLTLGDIAVLSGAVSGQDVDAAALVTVVENMFHIKPDVRAWTLEKMMVVVQAVVDYVSRRQKKTAPTMADLVRRQAASSAAQEPAETTPTSATSSGS